jgi:hypothetical protein
MGSNSQNRYEISWDYNIQKKRFDLSEKLCKIVLSRAAGCTILNSSNCRFGT